MDRPIVDDLPPVRGTHPLFLEMASRSPVAQLQTRQARYMVLLFVACVNYALFRRFRIPSDFSERLSGPGSNRHHGPYRKRPCRWVPSSSCRVDGWIGHRSLLILLSATQPEPHAAATTLHVPAIEPARVNAQFLVDPIVGLRLHHGLRPGLCRAFLASAADLPGDPDRTLPHRLRGPSRRALGVVPLEGSQTAQIQRRQLSTRCLWNREPCGWPATNE